MFPKTNEKIHILSNCSLAKDETIYQSSTKKKEVKQKNPTKGTHRLQLWILQITIQKLIKEGSWNLKLHRKPLESQGQPWACDAINNANERYSFAQTETTVWKISIIFSRQSLERAKLWEQIPCLNVQSRLAAKTQDTSMHDQRTKVLQNGMRSKMSLQGIKHTNCTKSSSR